MRRTGSRRRSGWIVLVGVLVALAVVAAETTGTPGRSQAAIGTEVLAPAGTSSCGQGTLSLTQGARLMGAGTWGQVYVVQNVGSATCALAGTPGMDAPGLAAGGADTPLPQAAVGMPAAQPISLAPGQEASFLVTRSACVYDAGAAVATAKSFVITLPGYAQTFSQAIGTTDPCDAETVQVGTLQPGAMPLGVGSGNPADWPTSAVAPPVASAARTR